MRLRRCVWPRCAPFVAKARAAQAKDLADSESVLQHDPMASDEHVGAATASYFRYWGKARPSADVGDPYHLLAFHSLDVAACGQELLQLRRFGLGSMADQLGWTPEQLRNVFTVFMALHDIGKFASAFQRLAKDLGPPLVTPAATTGTQRHDTMGWVLLERLLRDGKVRGLNTGNTRMAFWQQWFRIVAGHHGVPPKQQENGQTLQVEKYFHPADREAAQAFLEEAFTLLHTADLPSVGKEHQSVLPRLSWRLAGLAVLADWLGSGRPFSYRSRPQSLEIYWTEVALPQAREAISHAGLADQPIRTWTAPKTLLDFQHLTPLQEYAAQVAVTNRPQLFLLEDVTGAGKTEAALLLCHRLMQAGRADGLYFALPTMATANQLYQRVGKIYRKLYAEGATPSLVLSHGARDLVQGFTDSVLQEGLFAQPERSLQRDGEPPGAAAQCSAWLADSRKKAMLADVGVGTVDQALLAVLPVRHQSLRVLGLAHKVLVIDEVHAYDPYTSTLLRRLVEAQAMAGGSTILLSATVPAKLRTELFEAYFRGLGGDAETELAPDLRYPLITHAVPKQQVAVHACATRPELVRKVRIECLASEAQAAEWVLAQANAGRAVCWIRNTVDDARRAYSLLADLMVSGVSPDGTAADARLLLFHAQFIMGDRLDREAEVLKRFGKASNAALRRGQVLVATQVVEQSLDLDFDEMLSDLAPVDLLIQRAGRLHRHRRSTAGDLASDSDEDGRAEPVLHLLAPAFTEEPGKDWYARLFPKAQYVYEDAGRLWLTLRALTTAGYIVSPGHPGERGSVRGLIEAVYGSGVEDQIPAPLVDVTLKVCGKHKSWSSQGSFNLLDLGGGYSSEHHEAWYARMETPTRLGNETQTVYLAAERDGGLAPLREGKRFAWQMSALRLRHGVLGELSPAWIGRFRAQVEGLRGRVPLLSDPAEIVLPMVRDGEVWVAQCVTKSGAQTVRYSERFGLSTETAEG